MWSPYFRNPKDYVKQPCPGSGARRHWFEQYGFRGGKLSEDQIPHQGTACRRGRPTTGQGRKRRFVVGFGAVERRAGCLRRAASRVSNFIKRPLRGSATKRGTRLVVPYRQRHRRRRLSSSSDRYAIRQPSGLNLTRSRCANRSKAMRYEDAAAYRLVDDDAPEALARLQDVDGLVVCTDALQRVLQ